MNNVVWFLCLHGSVILHVRIQPGALVVSHVFAYRAMFNVGLVVTPRERWWWVEVGYGLVVRSSLLVRVYG